MPFRSSRRGGLYLQNTAKCIIFNDLSIQLRLYKQKTDRQNMEVAMKPIVLAACLLALTACAKEDSQKKNSSLDTSKNKQQAIELQEIADRQEALKDSAAQNLSCSQDSQCSVIAFGSKACGGPTGYVVVSSENAQSASLPGLAEAVTQLESSFNTKYEKSSTCEALLIPEAACRNNQCEAYHPNFP